MPTASTPTATTIVPVRTPSASYSVEIGTQLLPEIAGKLDALLEGRLHAGKARPFVVTSPELLTLWGEPLLASFRERPAVLLVPAGEQHKRLGTLERLAEELANRGADRNSVLIALGGGVLGDLTGFLAAIYMRGIPYIQVPTTLLAQVDSSVGGKTGANLLAGKNLLGAFHHPLAVYADIDTLQTLAPKELRAGLQESIKAGIIRDPHLFTLLEQRHAEILAGDPEVLHEVVAASVAMKSDVVSLDEREGGLRMILNLGHTLGHAIEAATNYNHLLHGEAIAWGMLAALYIAERRQTLAHSDATRIANLIRAYGPLPAFAADAENLVDLTAKDKKNRGGVRSFVLPTGIGSATVVHDVTREELLAAAERVLTEATS